MNQPQTQQFLVAPSILSADFGNLASEIRKVQLAGADWIHVDVMDGNFVPNLTIGAPVVKSLKPVTQLPFDVHLMIERPERYIQDFARAGADFLTIHVEATTDPAAVLNQIRALNVQPGITLRPKTPVERIFPFLPLVDLVLVMTVEPGFGGQSFMRDQVAKIGAIRAELKRIGHSALIEVDGGVNGQTAAECREADVLVAGSFVFNGDVETNITTLKKAKVASLMKLDGKSINAENLWDLAHARDKVQLSEAAVRDMKSSREYINGKVKDGQVIYGVNTGFGAFSNVRISNEDIVRLQQNLIRSHSCGVGTPFTKEQTRAIMILRANALARGHSGIRVEVVEKILEFFNADVIPVIPQQGSVGASGDLAPLAHLALALIGEGKVFDENETPVPTAAALKKHNIKPLELQAKEGLSLINGCQVMTAVGMLNGIRARRLLWTMDLAGAMSLEALKGSRSAFDPIIFETRPHPGEAKTARNLLKLLGPTSPIAESHIDCTKVQDAYSLRCMPAVHGAAKDAIRNNLATLEVEANSSTDNPLVFVKDDKILSCGNFHGEPVAFALDFMAIALAAAASMSECRIEKLINPAMSELPAFLAPNGGLNSGHMIVQVAAAALVSENKILTHPASVDSIPTSADKEDHVSMGTIAARKFRQVTENAENVVAMEILSATQALDMLKPLEPSGAIKAALQCVREKVPFAAEDRIFSDDIDQIREMIRSEKLAKVVKQSVGELEW